MNYGHRTINRISFLLIFVLAVSIIALPEETFAAAAKKKKVKKITFENAKNYRKVIKKGKKFKLKVTVSPKKASKKMKFVSSNKKIATVSKKGIVRAKKKGVAYITAYAKDGSGKKKRIKVIVGKPITKIKISGGNVVMKGKKLSLKAKITPSKASYKTVTWKSSNKKIATVNSKGKVTWKKDGKVTITATSKDGNKVKGKWTVNSATLKKEDTNYIAHRGYSSKAPENSLASFKLACQAGFQGVECDIWEVQKEPEKTTEDGIGVSDSKTPKTDFVVFHDSDLKRMTSVSGSVTEKTYEELVETKLRSGNGYSTYYDESIPSLEEYLDVIKKYPNSKPVIEIKSTSGDNLISKEGAKNVVEMLEEYELSQRASIITFGKTALKRFREADPDIHTMLLTGATGEKLDSYIDWAYENNINGLSINYKALSKSVVDKIHSLGMEVGVYTVNSQLDAYPFIKLMGVDYLTSDYKLFK